MVGYLDEVTLEVRSLGLGSCCEGPPMQNTLQKHVDHIAKTCRQERAGTL